MRAKSLPETLGELDCDGCWLVDDEIFEMCDGDVVIHQSEIVTRDLGKLHGNGSWLVDDEVLQMSDGHIVVHEGEIVTGNLGGLNDAQENSECKFVVYLIFIIFFPH